MAHLSSSPPSSASDESDGMPSRFVSPFNPLELSADEETSLHCEYQRVLQEACEDYDRTLQAREDARGPSLQHWKLLKQEGELRVYRERERHRAARSDQSFRFLTRGTITSNVEDAVFGCLAISTDQMRLRSACRDDPLQDAAVLGILQRPTRENPLNAISLQWASIRLPLGLHRLLKNPDFVVLDGTGFTRLPSGDDIGYYVMQSISLPQLPSLPRHTRVQFSTVTLFRQLADSRSLDVVVQMSFVLKLPAFASIMANHIGKLITNGGLAIHTTSMKKLSFLLRRRSPIRASESAPCITCGKNAPKIGSRRSTCNLCGNMLCRSCAHRKLLYTIGKDDRMIKYSPTLCRACVDRVAAVDVMTIADAAVNDHLDRLPSDRVWVSSGSDTTCISLTDNVAKLTLSGDWMRLSWSSDESLDDDKSWDRRRSFHEIG